jgi:hypothetical protein
VHFLHPEEMHFLHSYESHFLHPGALKAKISPWPGCNFVDLAKRQNLHTGERVNFAFRQTGKICMLARGKNLHPGEDRKAHIFSLKYFPVKSRRINVHFRAAVRIIRKGISDIHV